MMSGGNGVSETPSQALFSDLTRIEVGTKSVVSQNFRGWGAFLLRNLRDCVEVVVGCLQIGRRQAGQDAYLGGVYRWSARPMSSCDSPIALRLGHS